MTTNTLIPWRCLRSAVAWYLRLLWSMTKKAPAFWLGCFFGALIAQAPGIAVAAVNLGVAYIRHL